MLQILRVHSGALLSGATTTLELATIVWSVGLGLGIVLGIVRAALPRALKQMSALLFAGLSSIPILYLLWFHYPVQAAFQNVEPFVTAAFVLSVYNSLPSRAGEGRDRDFPLTFVVAQVNGL